MTPKLSSLTNDAMRALVAEAMGLQPMFAVEKGGWYYREGGHGYTASLEQAGRYTEQAAKRELCAGEPMTIIPLPIPNYLGDLNACAKMEETLTDFEEQYNYGQHLARMIFGDQLDEHNFSPNGWGYFNFAHAAAEHRVRAYLVAKGLADL